MKIDFLKILGISSVLSSTINSIQKYLNTRKENKRKKADRAAELRKEYGEESLQQAKRYNIIQRYIISKKNKIIDLKKDLKDTY